MNSVHYEHKSVRSALKRVEHMPFRWSLNPYQGCVHGCQYCYARRYHGFLELNAGHDFESIIFVKTNVAEVLRRELRRPSWQGEKVAIGTATDPYQPIEGSQRLTRACLEALCDHGNPAGLVTKGTMIVRDEDILSEMSRGVGVTVLFSLTSLDEATWRKLEPGTPPPWQRLRAMERLARAGVRAGVFIAPVVPGINDDLGQLERLVRQAADHGAQCLSSQTLYLRPGTKEHFLEFLEREYSDLVRRYRELYPGSYSPKRTQERIERSVNELKASYQLRDTPAPPERSILQLSFLSG